jgi:hypothetical protein
MLGWSLRAAGDAPIGDQPSLNATSRPAGTVRDRDRRRVASDIHQVGYQRVSPEKAALCGRNR